MKRKDIALIAVIVIVSAVISLVVSNAIFGSPSSHGQKAEVVQPITADFPQPDSRYFNKNAFDPTKTITIGQNANPDPFSGAQ
ncbi:MAG TPA: hypothetical protein VF401_02410 [Candidatus Saccharimonadales bacterium]